MVSVGSYEDLGPDRDPGPVDRNPKLPCGDCGTKFTWQDYWNPRVTDGDRVDDPGSDETWRCDECHEAHERLRRRRENNQPITAFIGGKRDT